MKLIFEENKDGDDFKGEDYIEMILTQREYEQLKERPIVKSFPLGLFDIRSLNASIRVDKINN